MVGNTDRERTGEILSVGTLPVRHDPASAAVVRHELAAQLRSRGVDAHLIDDAILVASELVANAIRHGSPVSPAARTGSIGIRVGWSFEAAAVVIFVEDGSSASPQRRPAGSRQPDGRGLAIVDAISVDWGVDVVPGGKQVWARVPTRG